MDDELIAPDSAAEWDMEQRAFYAANSDANDDVKALVKDLWAAFCDAQDEIARMASRLAKAEAGRRVADLNAEALAEIKASVDGQSDQTPRAIIYGLLVEIAKTKDKP